MAEQSKSKVILDEKYIRKFKHRFVTISIHTTGTNPKEDRISKIACVKYHNNEQRQSFFAKVDEQNEQEVIDQLAEFIKESLNGRVGIYVTGQVFDIDFLVEALKRYDYWFNIKYVNYTSFSRKYLKEVEDFPTLVKEKKKTYGETLLDTAKAFGDILVRMMN